MADDKKPEEKPARTTGGRVDGKEERPAPKDNLVVTQHKVRIGGREIKYTVTTGTIVLKEESPDREKESEGEKPRAHGERSDLHIDLRVAGRLCKQKQAGNPSLRPGTWTAC